MDVRKSGSSPTLCFPSDYGYVETPDADGTPLCKPDPKVDVREEQCKDGRLRVTQGSVCVSVCVAGVQACLLGKMGSALRQQQMRPSFKEEFAPPQISQAGEVDIFDPSGAVSQQLISSQPNLSSL